MLADDGVYIRYKKIVIPSDVIGNSVLLQKYIDDVDLENMVEFYGELVIKQQGYVLLPKELIDFLMQYKNFSQNISYIICGFP